MAIPFLIGFYLSAYLFKARIDVYVTATIIMIALAVNGNIPWY